MEQVDQKINLGVRRLSSAEVTNHLNFVQGYKHGIETIDLLDEKTDSWTVVVVERLKETLHAGRLGWIMSTALPLVPDFKLFLNKDEIVASKAQIPKLKTWRIGQQDEAAKKIGYNVGHDTNKTSPLDYYVEVPVYGRVSGFVELYEDPLDTGKSSQFGFSNGFFVMVRKRLINSDDNRFGITSIPYLAFNRFRAEVHADFLDSYLTASREDIIQMEAKVALQRYLHATYNEARNFYEKTLETLAKKETIEEHLKHIPGTLLGYPLRQAIERIISEESSGFAIQLEPGTRPSPTIQRIETTSIDVTAPLATLDNGRLVVNTITRFTGTLPTFRG